MEAVLHSHGRSTVLLGFRVVPPAAVGAVDRFTEVTVTPGLRAGHALLDHFGGKRHPVPARPCLNKLANDGPVTILLDA